MMEITKRTSAAVITILVAAVANGSSITSSWVEDDGYQNVQFSPVLFSATVESLSKCGSLCHLRYLCRGFTFIIGQGHCQGYSKFSNPAPLTGARFWKVEPSLERCAHFGYTLHSSASLCYMIVNSVAIWVDAVTECESLAGRLLVLETAHKVNNFLETGSGCIWIGLSDRDTEGTWKWIDGSPVTANRWSPSKNQPNDGDSNYPGESADCACLYSNGEWYDDYCQWQYNYICTFENN